MIEIKKYRINDLLSTGLAISHATMDKDKVEAKENSKPPKTDFLVGK
jgi:hypothetical protein